MNNKELHIKKKIENKLQKGHQGPIWLNNLIKRLLYMCLCISYSITKDNKSTRLPQGYMQFS
jgi:hypothetical protein